MFFRYLAEAQASEHILRLGVEGIDLGAQLGKLLFPGQPDDFPYHPSADVLVLIGLGDHDIHLAAGLQAHIAA